MRSIFVFTFIFSVFYSNFSIADNTTQTNNANAHLIDDIFQKMELAVDPDERSLELKTLKTVILLTLPMGNQKIKVITIDKFPNQSKTIQKMPNGVSLIRVLNKDTAWERVEPTGQFRFITGQELEFMKFEMYMKTPSVKLKDIFKDVKILDTEATVNDYECYKLQCQPRSSIKLPAIIIFVDKETYLTRQMNVTLQTPQGVTTLKNMMNKYKLTNGRMIPSEVTISQGPVTMYKKLLSVEENIPVDDSEFNPSKKSK